MIINSTTAKYLCALAITSGACIGTYKYSRYKSNELKTHKDSVLGDRNLYLDDFAILEGVPSDITADRITKASDVLTDKRANVSRANTIEKFDEALKIHDEFVCLLETFESAPNIIALIDQEYGDIQKRREEEQEKAEAAKKAQARRDALAAREQELNMAIRTAKQIGNYIYENREDKKDEEDC